MEMILEPLAASPTFFIGFTIVLGMLIGSFLNVVAYRMPIMMDNDLRAECAAGSRSPWPSRC